MGVPYTAESLRIQLRRTWLLWSCVPLVVLLAALAATTAAYASQPVLSPKRAEDSFYAFLAISALVFLLAFTVDGHWTNPKRIARHIHERLSRDEPSAGSDRHARERAEERAAIAADIVLGSSLSLGLMGQVIGIIAILCSISGAGPVYAYLLLAVAVSYQLYLLSRHPYYEQLVQAAYAGDLEVVEYAKGNRSQRVK